MRHTSAALAPRTYGVYDFSCILFASHLGFIADPLFGGSGATLVELWLGPRVESMRRPFAARGLQSHAQ
jgi:hypothetical protein